MCYHTHDFTKIECDLSMEVHKAMTETKRYQVIFKAKIMQHDAI